MLFSTNPKTIIEYKNSRFYILVVGLRVFLIVVFVYKMQRRGKGCVILNCFFQNIYTKGSIHNFHIWVYGPCRRNGHGE